TARFFILIPKLIGFGVFYIYDIELSPEPKGSGDFVFWAIAMYGELKFLIKLTALYFLRLARGCA
ncbi:hypothetical protein, partial [Rodentibacter ratti]|uniref:hypothetical protein n=1 Tax=Rodentibacter ratti TaxID=1906745 RepID=UPI001C4DE11C